MRVILILFFLVFTCCLCGQKRVMTYGFEFEKSFLQWNDYNTYFLYDNKADSFALLLQDNKKADYLLVSRNFKVVEKISSPIEKTVFGNDDKAKYIGGTASGGVYHFVYKSTKYKMLGREMVYYLTETVDFNTKTISQKELFHIPKTENLVASFSDNGKYFTITSDDKASNLIFYTLTENGTPVQKTIPFKVPEGMNNKKDEISEYLLGIQMIKGKEEPGLNDAVRRAKLFSQEEKLVFVVNVNDNPTHLFSVSLKDFSVQEKFINHDPLFTKDEKGKSYVSSFVKDNRLFSLVLNKKDIKIAVYDLQNGSLLNSLKINEDEGSNYFAEGPVYEERRGKKTDEKEVDDTRKLIKTFTKGTEGLTVYKNKIGQYVVTVGTYDHLPAPSGGSSGSFSSWSGKPALPNQATTWDQYKIYVPGAPGYASTSSRYYKTTYFKTVFDSSTLKSTRSKVPLSVSDQIKDYLEDIDKKAKATNQFNIGDNQYYGYYDRELHQYIIEQIIIRK